MEQFFAEYPAAGYVLIVGLLGLIWWLVKMAIADKLAEIKDVKAKFDSIESRIDEIETNYKNEFKLIRVEAQNRHLEVLDKLTELQITIAEIRVGSER